MSRPKAPLRVDMLVQVAAAQSARKDPNLFFDQKLARTAYLNLFRRLQAAGAGHLIVGRRGHPTRFEYLGDHAWRDLETALLEMDLGTVAGQEAPNPEALDDPGLPVRSVRPTRESVVAEIKKHQDEIRKFGVASLALFGSVARDEAKPDSDIDLVVTFKDPVTSDGFFGVKFFLEDLLGRRIDLITDSALREPIRTAVQSELVSVA